MNKLYLAFGVHNHQPVGNFDVVIEQVSQSCYLPYLELLTNHPEFRSSIHFSGVLLDWLLEHHPAVADRIRLLVDRGQLELLTGGHYEPILPVIPDRDKIGQIAMYTESLKRRFGVRPRGMWLAERVWEPHLARPIVQAGVSYTVLDDTHFKYSGLTDNQLFGYYVTEEEGYILNLLPIAKKLRYTIPFAPPAETIAYLRRIAEQRPNAVVVYADDGEKFGSWPETYNLVWENGWLESFLKELQRHTDWLEVIPFGEVMRRVPPLGRVYLPTASYAEMSEWALPVQAERQFESFQHQLQDAGKENTDGIFARGGFWRNFLVKYPEANKMHKRMLAISAKIHRWAQEVEDNNSAVAEARDHLYQAQCNCAYWHGVFGGLYLPHLRAAVWEHLIAADHLAEPVLRGRSSYVFACRTDFDADGRDELEIGNEHFHLCINTDLGGSIIEHDIYDYKINLIDGLTRREEAYHRKLADAVYKPAGEPSVGDAASIHDRVTTKEKDLEKYLYYDWYRRGSFIDHFFGESADSQSFARNDYPELGDFVNQAFTVKIEENGGSVRAILRRRGGVWIGPDHVPIEIEKTFGVEAGNHLLKASYRITNCWYKSLSLRFGTEFCVALQSDNRPRTAFRFDREGPEILLSAGGHSGQHGRWTLTDRDRDLVIAIECDRDAEWWYFPLYTVSLSEDGFERTYQSTIICPVWQIELAPGATWTTLINQYAGRSADAPN